MATVLKLVWGATEVELNKSGDTAGFHLRNESWHPVVARSGGNDEAEPVIETLELIVRPANDNGYATLMQSLHDMARYAIQYATDRTATTPVWLHCKLDNETGERRALVYAINIQYGTPWFSSAQAQGHNIITVTIERGPYWEATSATALFGTDDTDLVNNGQFEVSGTPHWQGWTENESDGSIDQTTRSEPGYPSPAKVAQLTAGASVDTYIEQTVTVEAGKRYTFYGEMAGDGTYSGRVQLYDSDNAADILALTSLRITSTAYSTRYYSFIAPTGCTSVRIRLYCPDTNTGIAYFDGVGVSENMWGAARIWPYTRNASIVGDVGGRIAPVVFAHEDRFVALPPSGSMDKLWAGVRSANKHGTLDNFVAVWECEVSGAALGTDATRTYENGASPEWGGDYTRITVTPGTATLAKRLTIALEDVTSNYTDQYGSYLWLLRAKAASGETWDVHLRWGYTNEGTSTVWTEGPVTEVSGDEYFYYPMGLASIPFHDERVWADLYASGMLDDYSVEIWAERTSGSGSLYLDCLVLIPTDEGFVMLDDIGIEESDADYAGKQVGVAMSPQGTLQAISLNAETGAIFSFPEVSGHAFTLPPGDGIMVIAYQSETGASLSTCLICDSLDSASQMDAPAYYPRWLSLRGSE